MSKQQTLTIVVPDGAAIPVTLVGNAIEAYVESSGYRVILEPLLGEGESINSELDIVVIEED